MRAARSAPAAITGRVQIVSSGAAWYAAGQVLPRGAAVATPPAACRSGTHLTAGIAGCGAAQQSRATHPHCRSVFARKRLPHRGSIAHRRAVRSCTTRLMIAIASPCISHDHAEALSIPFRITSARIVAARDARQIALTGLGGFGTLTRK